MRLCFTRPAARQLDGVLAFIARHDPQGAQHVQTRIREVLRMLSQHPFAGHVIARPGIRRVLTLPYPYAITYRVGEGEIVVRSVRHTARRPLV